VQHMNDFIATALKAELAQSQGGLLAAALSAGHHINYACRAMTDVLEQHRIIQRVSPEAPEHLAQWQSQVEHWLENTTSLSSNDAKDMFSTIKIDYQILKQHLIQSATQGKHSIDLTDAALTEASFTRRFAEQLIQASDALQQLLRIKDEDQDKAPSPDKLAEQI
ncbi:hypothetical protein, partial [Halorubrum tibetense]